MAKTIVTYSMLVRNGACNMGASTFFDIFGECTEVTLDVIKRGFAEGMTLGSIEWFARTFFEKKALDEFENRRYTNYENYGLKLKEYRENAGDGWLLRDPDHLPYYHRYNEKRHQLFEEMKDFMAQDFFYCLELQEADHGPIDGQS